MSWLGKVIGGTIGFALGGPLGAIAGAAFGHGFDKKEDRYFQGSMNWDGSGNARPSGQGRLSGNEEAQLVFFTAAFSMLAKISKADGRVVPEEIAIVDGFMKNELQLDANTQETAKNIFRQAIHSPSSFDDFANQFYMIFKFQPHVMDLMMDILFRVSMADGKMDPGEEAMLQNAARIFRFSQAKYQQFVSTYLPQADGRDYAVLKLDKTATDAEIKKQYRILVNEYHPDKIQSKGLPEEFVKLANDKFIEVQNAYENIKKERGFS